MNKPNTIAWHEECLRNNKKILASYRQQMYYIEGLIVGLQFATRRLEMQIETAKRRGKKSFDRDRFMRGKA
jgi:hypothetical protein